MNANEPLPVKIALAMPHQDGWALYASVMCVAAWPTQRFSWTVLNRGTSLLTLTFNQLFCDALNLRDKEEFTHFAMLHNDVVPCQNWIDILMDELVQHELDVIAAVIPLKDSRGLTSTATDKLENPWAVRRLSMTEVMQYPPTFTAQDVPHREPGSALLLNTG